MARRGWKHHQKRKKMVVRLYEEQGGKCAYCGEEMVLRGEFNNSATKDHIIPRCRGGVSEHWNLVAACRKCNNEKGSRPLIDFLWIITKGKPEKHWMHKLWHIKEDLVA